MNMAKVKRFMVLTLVFYGMAAGPRPAQGANEPWEPTGQETQESMKARTSIMNRPKEIGTYYKAEVPDTLDLAERARLGINVFTANISEKSDYEMPWTVDPVGENFSFIPLMACQCKAMEVMPMLRVMSGSQQNLERETRMLEMLASHIGPEGVYWVPWYENNPWRGPKDQMPYASAPGQGRMLAAITIWYEYTGDPKWKELGDRIVDGMDRVMVVHKGDYAYFPVRGWIPEDYFNSCYTSRGWKDTTEPKDEKSGEEGSLFNHQGQTPAALVNWYMLTGNKQALRLSGELVRFLTKPQFWADWPAGDYPGVVGADHAHWRGHYTAHINTLRAILEYAVATNDVRLMQFVRDGYEWSRQQVFARIGFGGGCCGNPRLLGLAVELSDAGVGDYWEDVDLYVRNHVTEMQFTPEDIPYLKALGGQAAKDECINNMIGGFGWVIFKDRRQLCCSPHGNMGLFYAWDGTLRYSDGVVRVNLLLNRASPWMDIDSHLPYEGKVVIKNKRARELFVRIPLWVDRKAVRCVYGSKDVPLAWFGNYIHVNRLRPRDVLTILFPMVERTEQWNVSFWEKPKDLPNPQVYTLKFKGNTLIEISPPLVPGSPLFKGRPAKYQATAAPVKKVLRYVSNQTLQW